MLRGLGFRAAHFFREGVDWGEVSVALAVDRGVGASADRVHLPVRVVVIDHVEIPVSAPAILIH